MLLLLELSRPVMVRLLLRHLLILFLETGSLMTLLLYDVYLLFCFFVFGALYFGRPSCIYRHWLLYIYDIGGLWIALVVCVYGFVFMDMCLWIGV